MMSGKFPSIYSRVSLSQGLRPLFATSFLLALLSPVAAAQELSGDVSLVPPSPSHQIDLLMPSDGVISSAEVPADQSRLNHGGSSQSVAQQTVAQQNIDQPDAPPTVDQLRERLQIEPLPDTSSVNSYGPGSAAAIPEGFGSEWGDVFITVTGASKDRVRTTFIDSGISTGFGLGNPRNLVGVELAYNILSTRTQFAVNGSFDLKVHRYIVEQPNFVASAALGVANFYSYGPEASLNPPVAYGVVSGFTYLRPDNLYEPMPLTVTLGTGGAPIFAESGVGLIAGAGVQVHPQIGLGSSWNAGGFNLGASFLPFRNVPLTLTALYTDVFNMTTPGHRLVLSLGYSYRFK